MWLDDITRGQFIGTISLNALPTEAYRKNMLYLGMENYSESIYYNI